MSRASEPGGSFTGGELSMKSKISLNHDLSSNIWDDASGFAGYQLIQLKSHLLEWLGSSREKSRTS
jgi:hypothetical protein